MIYRLHRTLRLLQKSIEKNAPHVREKLKAAGCKDEALVTAVALHFKTLEKLARG